MFVHTALARRLHHMGVKAIFGVAGDGNLLMIDDLIAHGDVRYISTSHEAGCVLMADGYARSSGELGVATVTRGPGVTNTVTALVEAVRCRTPLLLIAGDTVSDRRGHMQDIDQRAVFAPTGAGFEQLRSGATAVEDLDNAARRAFVERRPIVLNVPEDLHRAEIDDAAVNAGLAAWAVARQAPAPDPHALDLALGVIASARRPLVVAGRGAVEAGARDAIVDLAGRIGAPVATSLLAKDWFDGAPHNLGIMGTLSTPVAAEVITQSDCIISFGASLNELTTGRGAYVASSSLIQCDTDATAIGKWQEPTVGVIGDARIVAETMATWWSELGQEPSGVCSDELASRLASGRPEGTFDDLSNATTIDPRALSVRMDELLPPDRIVVCDGGRFSAAPATYLKVAHPRDWVMAVSFGSIGLGVSEAIGACVANPGRTVVAAVGDGGFMLGGLAELNTAVRARLNLVVLVYNDSCYGAEHNKLRSYGRSPASSYYPWPDLAPVADALGAVGLTVRSANDLDAVKAALAQQDGPILIDAKLDADVAAVLRV